MPEMIFLKKLNKYDNRKGKIIALKFTLEKYEHMEMENFHFEQKITKYFTKL